MITLTIIQDGLQYQQTFSHEKITIGSGIHSDIKIDKPGIAEIHLELCKSKDTYTLSNLFHDPQVTLNGLAFGRRSLRAGDTFFIHSIEATVSKIGKKRKTPLPEKSKSSTDQLLEEVNRLQPSPNESQYTAWFQDSPKEKAKISYSWQWVGIAAAVLTLMMVGGLTLPSHEINEEGLQEAELAVADVGMSLLSAHINHVKIPTKNWTAPEVIEYILPYAIGNEHSPALDMERDGLLPSGEYKLSVIANRAQTDFVVIAFPTGSLSQWWSPKPVVVFDRQLLGLRKLNNSKRLRLLTTNPYPLEEPFAEDIHLAVEEGEEIPSTFSLPGLEMAKPGASKHLYNLPRYSPFTDNFIANLVEKSSIDIHHSIDHLEQMEDLLLYTSGGQETAWKAFTELSLLQPKDEYLIASLEPNPVLLAFHRQDRPAPPETVVEEKQPEWVLELNRVKQEREEALLPLAHQIAALFINHSRHPNRQFSQNLGNLLEHFSEEDKQQRQAVEEMLSRISQGVNEEDAGIFVEAVEASGLSMQNYKETSPLQAGLSSRKQPVQDIVFSGCSEAVEKPKENPYIQHIRLSPNFYTLYHDVDQAFEALEEKDVTLIKEETLKRIKSFLLPAKEGGLPELLEKDRYTMQYILRKPEIATTEEYGHYNTLFNQRRPQDPD